MISALAVADIGAQEGRSYTLRWALINVIEETTRRAGHSDDLREQTDRYRGR